MTKVIFTSEVVVMSPSTLSHDWETCQCFFMNLLDYKIFMCDLVFQVRGLNQELAANVVAHRERRGPFRSVDDLAKVKGLGQWRLNAMRSQLCAQPPSASSVSGGLKNCVVNSGISSNSVWKSGKMKKSYSNACDNQRKGEKILSVHRWSKGCFTRGTYVSHLM